MRARMEAFVAAHPEGWVSEGNYSRVNEVTLSRCDTLISLDVPWRVSFVRLFKRTVARADRPEASLQRRRAARVLARVFFSRQSILLWSITNHQKRKRRTVEAFAEERAGYALAAAQDVARGRGAGRGGEASGGAPFERK